MYRRIPVRRERRNLDGLNGKTVWQLDLDINHVGRKTGGMRQNLKGAKGCCSAAIDNWNALVIPSASSEPGAFSIVLGIFRPANPVEGQSIYQIPCSI